MHDFDPLARLSRLLAGALLLSVLLVSPAGAELERSAAFQKGVDRAIDRGVAWLFGQQESDGGWPEQAAYPCGTTALAYHTLRICGVSRDDRRMKRGYAALRREYDLAKRRRMLRTYAVALTMMAIEEHGRERSRPEASRERYGNQDAGDAPLEEADREWMKELVAFLERAQNQDGTWGYSSPGRGQYDHSNTQYALLGLKSASRSGVEVKDSVYTRALEHLIATQEKTGPKVRRHREGGKGRTSGGATDKARGWTYHGDADSRSGRRRRGGFGRAYGSMTAGSVGAVVICRSELLGRKGYGAQLDGRAETSIRDGIAWLGHHFDARSNPQHGGWLYYYLYAVERAGVLSGVDWMADHDWYGEGADFLVGAQRPEGFWTETGMPHVTTCFALLFLKRGTARVARGAVTSSSEASSINFGVAKRLSARDFEDFIDLVLSKWARAGATQETRDELARRTTAIGPRIVLPLLQRLSADRADKRRAAYAILDHATGEHLPFDPEAGAAERAEQVVRWEEWYLLTASTLDYDPALGRLVAR